ncbi:MAG: MBL fold metallo-hydrolase [Candidatus Diapherotrites archaeon]
MSRYLKLNVLGAGKEVGRSSLLLDFGEKVLLDRGVKLSPEGAEYPLPVKENLDAIVISHGHMDHSGDLPKLFLRSHAMTYLTKATMDISKMLWFDSLKIAGLEGFDAGFSKDDIARAERYSFQLPYKKHVNITRDTSLEFHDAGHIVGAALCKLFLPNGKNVLYTGDFNYIDTRLHNKADLKVGKVDVLISEATYGNREHPPRKEVEQEFVESVEEVLSKGGHAIISAFAVGRSQEIVDVLVEHKIDAPIYLDGMCQKAASIMLQHPDMLANPKALKRALQKVNWVKKPNVRKEALKEPAVVVTTSGMLQGGPVQYYLRHLYKDEKSKLFLTGFQVKDTPGRQLLDSGKMFLEGHEVNVKMQVEKFDFSAHCDHAGLRKAIAKIDPARIVLVHGDAEIVDQFRQELHAEGFKVDSPKNGETLDLL